MSTVTAPKKQLREADVVQTCVDFLRAHHFEPIRLQNGLVQGYKSQSVFRLGTRGRADWAFVRTRTAHGSLRTGMCEFFYVEFKAPGKALDPHQEAWIQQARKEGYVVLVADSIDRLRQEFEEVFSGK